MKCRTCDFEATCAIRSGLEFHPTCDDCAAWWSDSRRYPLSEVAPDYEYLDFNSVAPREGSRVDP